MIDTFRSEDQREIIERLTSNLPRFGLSLPASTLSAVDLPIPLVPTRPSTCPGRGTGSLHAIHATQSNLSAQPCHVHVKHGKQSAVVSNVALHDIFGHMCMTDMTASRTLMLAHGLMQTLWQQLLSSVLPLRGYDKSLSLHACCFPQEMLRATTCAA